MDGIRPSASRPLPPTLAFTTFVPRAHTHILRRPRATSPRQASLSSSFTSETHLRRPVRSSLPHALTRASSTTTQACDTTPFLSIDSSVLASLRGRHVALTGATGLIGRALVPQLHRAGARVTVLARNLPKARSLFLNLQSAGASAGDSRSHPPAMSFLSYDAAEETPLSPAVVEALGACDVIVNLSGEPVEQGRWTPVRKKQLYSSRVVGTQRIVAALQKLADPPALVSASAVGYYGASETDTNTEDNAHGDDYLARLAADWELAAQQNTASRTAIFRIGVVLSMDGGALVTISRAFRSFLGGVPGGGTQWFSWVHIDDVVRLLVTACTDASWSGVYNATAPQPVRMAEFCQALGRAMSRPAWLPVPKSAVMALLGNEAAQLILAGQNVLPKRTKAMGFVFRYKDVRSALDALMKPQEAASVRS